MVVIIGRWGTTAPSGSLYMQKPANANGSFPAPVLLPTCAITNQTTREFNTACTLPQILKTLTVNNVTTYTTYNTVLFTGDDPHFLRK
jgi:hypothetical protein